ncbi:MAG: translesion error-prone DNA polymerase V autoproteolytic subunit [Planctomycetes bacterium]|nr:translesion error-prone DNA polymerase V autoproteolytic subunit [Planctomycetota bacterium]
MSTKVEAIFTPDITTRQVLPFIEAALVPAGFPSPAGDYEEGELDLNKHLIKNPAATYCVRVTGDSMNGAGIHSGDILIVDRSKDPQNGNVIIAHVNGELTVKRLRKDKGKIYLVAENSDYPDREIVEDMEFEVWGVVTNVIHSLE